MTEVTHYKKGSNPSSITLAESGGLRTQRALQRPPHVWPADDVTMETGAGRAHALDDTERELLVPDLEASDGADEGLVGVEPATHGVLLLPEHKQAFACKKNGVCEVKQIVARESLCSECLHPRGLSFT